jgi:hypothetical protein
VVVGPERQTIRGVADRIAGLGPYGTDDAGCLPLTV